MNRVYAHFIITPSLGNLSILVLSSHSKRQVAMSLYNDEPDATSTKRQVEVAMTRDTTPQV